MSWYIRGLRHGPPRTTLASGRVGGKKKRKPAQVGHTAPMPQPKMRAKDIRKLDPEILVYSLVGNDLSSDDWARVHKVYGDVPQGRGGHGGEDNYLKSDRALYGGQS